jgi:hypothetical protein
MADDVDGAEPQLVHEDLDVSGGVSEPEPRRVTGLTARPDVHRNRSARSTEPLRVLIHRHEIGPTAVQQHERPAVATVVTKRDPDSVAADDVAVTSHARATSHDREPECPSRTCRARRTGS